MVKKSRKTPGNTNQNEGSIGTNEIHVQNGGNTIRKS